MLIGGKTIIDHTNEQQKMLEIKRQEIAEQVFKSTLSTILLKPTFVLLSPFTLNVLKSKFNLLSCWQIRREREIQQQMMLQDEETVEMMETFSSLQQEVEQKTKKLKRVG